MLEIKDLWVKVEGKDIIKGVNIKVPDKSIKVLIGPNGSGKTTLSFAIMGHPKYEIKKGKIILDGKDITKKGPTEKSKMGLFLFFQNPPEIDGVKLKKVLSAINHIEERDMIRIFKKWGFKEDVLNRYFNKGFSGGEKKKNEIIQVELLKPKIVIMDEPDSGLDSDSIKKLAKTIEKMKNEGTSFLIITHQYKMIDMLDIDSVYVMKDSTISAVGGKELVEKIEKEGYNAI